eukprot:Amastigsp_a676506_166.p6 type:complete len:103 gc:universal Amastigsp_a676506_166:883-1191(+)
MSPWTLCALSSAPRRSSRRSAWQPLAAPPRLRWSLSPRRSPGTGPRSRVGSTRSLTRRTPSRTFRSLPLCPSTSRQRGQATSSICTFSRSSCLWGSTTASAR